MNLSFWKEFKSIIADLNSNPASRCIVLSSLGKSFSFGLDLKDEEQLAILTTPGSDPARKAHELQLFISRLQSSLTILEQSAQPVISCVDNHCFGGGMDLVCCADIRHCTADAQFSIKEVDVGICPDLGTLQRLERQVGNSSLVRELAFTGRVMTAKEAKECGFVSRVFSNKDEMLTASLQLAHDMAKKSPMAIAGIKRNLNYARGRPVADSLEFQAQYSASALQTVDLKLCLEQILTKKPVPHFTSLLEKQPQ